MIWESVYLMTAFDLVIVGGAVFALYVFFRSFRVIAQFRSNSAVFAITAGIVCIGAIYFVDLLSMHVFPLFLSATQSMTIMRNLHFNISWIATAFAVGLLVFGFWRLMRNASLFVTTLGRDERDVAGKLEIYRGIENELRATRDRYREAVSARSDWIWETGKDGRLVSISERFYEVTGFRSEDFIGRRFGEAPHWRGNEEVAKFVRAKLRKREAFESIRFESVGPAGESHFLELDGKPVFDEAGAFEGFRGTGRDVTEVERTKEILGLLGQTLDDAVGEEFVQKLVENLAMVLDADYAFIGELAGEDDDQIRSIAVYAHGAPAENFEYALAGAPCENVVGQAACIYPKGVQAAFPDDRMLVDKGIEAYAGTPLFDRDWGAMGILVVLWESPIEELESIEIAINAFAARAAAELTRMHAERSMHRAEARLRSVFDNLPMGVSLKDAAGRFALFNKKFEEWYGHSEAELRGKFPDEFFDEPEDTRQRRDEHQTVVMEKGEVVTREETKLRADGTIRTVEITKFPVLDAEGNIASIGTISSDITERRQVEEALRKSESLFRTTIDNLPLGLNVKNLDGRYLLVNETMSRRYGIAKDDFIGKTNHEIFPDAKESNEAAREQELELLRTKSITRREQKKTFQDGTTHTLLIDKFPILDDSGELVSIGVAGVDITELKQAQAKNESLATAIQSLNGHFSLYDKDDRLVVCNENTRQFNKAIAQKLEPGSSFEDMIRAIAENGLSPEAEGREEEWIAERMERHRNPGEPFELTRQDGQWLMIHEQRLADGSTVSIARNITEIKRAEIVLRESEERFRSLVDHLSDSIIVFNAKGRVRFVNREACRSLGYDEDELLRLSVSDLAVGYTAEEIRVLFDRIQRGESLVEEGRNRRKDGRQFPVEVMFDKFEMKGEPLVMANARDVTKRKQIEAQLIQSAKLATLGEMAAGLVHELSQPLNIIRFAAEGSILKMENETLPVEEQAKQFGTIDAQCQRMAKIIEHMRIFSRQDDATEEIFDPIEAVKSALSLVEAQLATDGIEISAKLPRHSHRAWGRMIQFEQVVLNLLTNAGDAIAEKRNTPDVDSDWTGQIVIEGTLQESTQTLQITVTDNGLGIREENLDHIFQPFFTTKDPAMGTGLGLSISHQIITSMAGTLCVKPADAGTRFEITLPYIGKEEAARPVEGLPRRVRKRSDADFNRRHILFVDDEAEVVSAAAGHFQSRGHRVSTAADGVEAFDLFLKDTADVVVTDIRMPCMDGKELIRELRNLSPDLPIIVLTGQLGLTEDLDEGIRPHVHQVLKKPVSLRILEDAVVDAMRRG